MTYFGSAIARLGQISEARNILNSGWERLQRQNHPPSSILCLTFLSLLSRGFDVKESKAFITKALHLTPDADEPLGQSMVYIILAEVNNLLGEYDNALHNATKGFDLATQFKWGWGIANGQRILGQVGVSLGDYEKAAEHFRASIDFLKTHDIRSSLIETLVDLSRAYRCLGQIDEAKQCCSESRKHSEELQLSMFTSLILWEEGCVAEKSGDYPTASELFAESMTLKRNPNLWGRVLPTMGWALLGLGKLNEAQKYFLQAYSEASAKQLIPISFAAQIGLAYTEEIQARQSGSNKQADATVAAPFSDILQTVYSHPAATQETRDRAAKIGAETGTSLL